MIIALTVSYIALVFTLMARFFELKKIFLPLLILSSTAVVSFEYLVHYYNYTGVIVGLLAGNFAMGAMLVCINAHDTNTIPKFWVPIAIVLSLFSIFSKEEFALPMILISGWAALKAHTRVRDQARIVMVSQILFLFSAILIQKLGGPSFISGAGDYHPNFSALSIIKTFANYLTASPGAVIALSLQLTLLLLVFLCGAGKDKEKLIFVQVIIGALILPFSILPGHFFHLYAFDWIPWQCSLLLCISLWLDKPSDNRIRSLCALISLLLLPVLLKLTEFDRINLLEYYNRETKYVTNVLNTLKVNRALLNEFPIFTVTGAKISSPWCWVRGNYFPLRLGIKSRWKFFVAKDSSIYVMIRGPYANNEKDNVEILDIAELPSYETLPCLKLNEMGGGTVISHQESKN